MPSAKAVQIHVRPVHSLIRPTCHAASPAHFPCRSVVRHYHLLFCQRVPRTQVHRSNSRVSLDLPSRLVPHYPSSSDSPDTPDSFGGQDGARRHAKARLHRETQGWGRSGNAPSLSRAPCLVARGRIEERIGGRGRGRRVNRTCSLRIFRLGFNVVTGRVRRDMSIGPRPSWSLAMHLARRTMVGWKEQSTSRTILPPTFKSVLTTTTPTTTAPAITTSTTMAAPGYKPSMDGTTVGPNDTNTSYPPTGLNGSSGTGKAGPIDPNSAANDDELHRFVTDDAPRQNRIDKARSDGLITVQPLRKNEMQPSYAQDLGTGSIEHGFYGSMMNGLGACIGTIGMIPCCPFPNPFKSVDQGSVGLISRFGQFYKSVDPGLVKVNVCSETIRVVDVKIQLTAVPRQTVQTKDNVSVEVDSVICWHVVSPYRAAFGINDVRMALVERAQTTLRQVVGGRVLQSVISDREGLAHEVAEIIEATAEKWGVAIESILLKDINFSVELQQSLSSAATQKRIGESKVIAARAEVDAAKLMRQAADILASPAAMQIRQLEALQNMARGQGSKVIFVPMNLGTMGAAGLDNSTAQQLASSSSAGQYDRGSSSPVNATNAGIITAMAQI